MKTILIVDDFASVRFYHATFLKQRGYECLTASDGAAALKLLDENTVDLVLLDMVMPGMNGLQFVEKVRSLPRGAELPIIAITSETALRDNELLRERKNLRFLAKPVLPAPLYEEVRRLLQAP